MASKAPPDGWVMETGVWGTDADRVESSVASGVSGVQFLATTTATAMISDPFPLYDYSIHGVFATFAPGRVNVGDTITIELELYDEDGVSAGTLTVFSAKGTAVDTLETRGRSFGTSTTYPGAVTGRLRLKKVGVAFTVTWDRVGVHRANPFAITRFEAGAGLTVGSTTTFTFPAGPFKTDDTGLTLEVDLTNDRINFYEPAIYLVEVDVVVEDLDNAGDYMEIQVVPTNSIIYDSTSPTAALLERSSDIINVGGTKTLVMNYVTMIHCYRDDAYIQVKYFIPNNGSTPQLDSGRLRVVQMGRAA